MKLFPAFAGGVLAVAVVFMTYAVNAQPGWSPKEGAFPAMWAGTPGQGFSSIAGSCTPNSATCFWFFADGV